MDSGHTSVLPQEVLAALQVQAGAWYLDATFGRGGHTRLILEQGGQVVALDCDQEAIEFGQQYFKIELEQGKLILIRENFDQLKKVLDQVRTQYQIQDFSGVFFDFGVSSPQLESAERGFSFQYDAELDMRMDNRLGVKAKDLVNLLSEQQLTETFWKYGGERASKKIAHSIVTSRQRQPINTVGQLVKIIEQAQTYRGTHLHPATKVFQALRIIVNSELDSIELALPLAYEALKAGGRIVTISFHEGEDRIVKQLFRDWEQANKGMHLTHKVITPQTAELEQNNRSRSAKMRIFEKKIEL